ncbi:MAG: helix-turn-helix transcriptional regulator [Abditibacteriota bacterium]|nr:helix-turn-helix transcriptional regulator [Abditibacteriota bacterium]
MSNDPFGRTWEEFEKEVFTPEEIAESKLRVALMCRFIDAGNEAGISQRELEKLSGISQSSIARMEKGYTVPQLNTLLKLLAAMGKTLDIVPLEKPKSA